WYGWFTRLAPTPLPSFGADGGPLPLLGYVEAKTSRFSLLQGQAYDDTGARWYASSLYAQTPTTYFYGADGGPFPLLMVRTDQRHSFESLMFSSTAVPLPPIYYGLRLIPNVWFANCAELPSILNSIISVVNSNTFTLGVPISYFLPMFKFIHPSAFNDAINDMVTEFNYLVVTGMKLGIGSKLKLFLSVSPTELTLAVNTL